MKNRKIIGLTTPIVALFTVCTLYAQRGGFHGGGGGGFHGGGREMHGFNHYGYAARPYFGVGTVPFGYLGYGSGCGYVGYWHQWRCY